LVVQSEAGRESPGERAAAEKFGELFGTGRPEKKRGKLIPFPNPPRMQNEPADESQQAFANH